MAENNFHDTKSVPETTTEAEAPTSFDAIAASAAAAVVYGTGGSDYSVRSVDEKGQPLSPAQLEAVVAEQIENGVRHEPRNMDDRMVNANLEQRVPLIQDKDGHFDLASNERNREGQYVSTLYDTAIDRVKAFTQKTTKKLHEAQTMMDYA